MEGEFKPERAKVAVLAALLHDIGHGPLSHAFEEARKALAESEGGKDAKAKVRKHEEYTAGMVENEKGKIAPILTQLGLAPSDVAN